MVDRALAADPFFWQAHYHRARALALLSRWTEALSAAERAAELNPGNDRAHALAWLVAYTLADDETAWEHAIRAQQAGADMTVQFELLGLRRPGPADLRARLAAPKVFVSRSPTTDLALQATLKRVYRALGRTLSGAPGIALVDDPSRGAFVVTLPAVLRDMYFSSSDPGPGDRVPEFDLPTVGGGRFRSSDLAETGPALLIFGSSTCPVTDNAAPGLKELYVRFGDRVRFVAQWANDTNALAAALDAVVAGQSPRPLQSGGVVTPTLRMLRNIAPVLDRAGSGAWAHMWRVAPPLAAIALALKALRILPRVTGG